MRRRYLATAIALTLACAGAQPSRPDPNENYGLLPRDYKRRVQVAFDGILRESKSARFRFGAPRTGYQNENPLLGGDVVWTGYIVPVTVSSMNDRGGYGEYRRFWVQIRNGLVRDVHRDSGLSVGLVRYSDGTPVAEARR